jgi:hypothetical protein
MTNLPISTLCREYDSCDTEPGDSPIIKIDAANHRATRSRECAKDYSTEAFPTWSAYG